MDQEAHRGAAPRALQHGGCGAHRAAGQGRGEVSTQACQGRQGAQDATPGGQRTGTNACKHNIQSANWLGWPADVRPALDATANWPRRPSLQQKECARPLPLQQKACARKTAHLCEPLALAAPHEESDTGGLRAQPLRQLVGIGIERLRGCATWGVGCRGWRLVHCRPARLCSAEPPASAWVPAAASITTRNARTHAE